MLTSDVTSGGEMTSLMELTTLVFAAELTLTSDVVTSRAFGVRTSSCCGGACEFSVKVSSSSIVERVFACVSTDVVTSLLLAGSDVTLSNSCAIMASTFLGVRTTA